LTSPTVLYVAIAGALTLSFSGIFVRAASVTPVTAAFYRTAYAIPVLVVWWWWGRHRDRRSPYSRLLAGAAGLFFSADLVAFHAAIGAVGAGLATLIANSQVLLIGLVGWLMWKERPSNTALTALPVVAAGLTLVTGVGRTDTYGDQPVLGTWLALLSALFYAAFLILWRQSNKELAPAAGPLLDASVGATIGSGVFGAFLPLDFQWEWPAHGWLVLMAIVCQVLAWQMIGWALPRLPGLQTSFVILLQPAMTFVWGAIFFAERLSAVQGVGVALVFAAIAAVVRRGAVRPLVPAGDQ